MKQIFKNNSIVYRVDTANKDNNFISKYTYSYNKTFHEHKFTNCITGYERSFNHDYYDNIDFDTLIKLDFKQTIEEVYEQIIQNSFGYIDNTISEQIQKINDMLHYVDNDIKQKLESKISLRKNIIMEQLNSNVNIFIKLHEEITNEEDSETFSNEYDGYDVSSGYEGDMEPGFGED